MCTTKFLRSESPASSVHCAGWRRIARSPRPVGARSFPAGRKGEPPLPPRVMGQRRPSSRTPQDDGPSAESQGFATNRHRPSYCNRRRPQPPSPTRTHDTHPPSPRNVPAPDRRPATPPSRGTPRSRGKRRQGAAPDPPPHRPPAPPRPRPPRHPRRENRPTAPDRRRQDGPHRPTQHQPPANEAPTDGSPPDDDNSVTVVDNGRGRNTPFGNCSTYASKSVGSLLPTIDCQNRASNPALPVGGDADWADAAGPGAAADAGRCRNVVWPGPDDRSAATDGPSR